MSYTDRATIPAEQWDEWTTNGLGGLRQHIDHVLSTPDIHWLGFERSHPYGVAGTYHGISDHVPKIGTFALAA